MKALKVASLMRTCLLVSASAFLVQCATVPKQPADTAGMARVKTIALLKMDEPVEFYAGNQGGALFVLGPIGAVAQAENNKEQTAKFSEEMRKHQLTVGDEMEQRLVQDLQAKGYKTIVLPDQRPVRKEGGGLDYSHIQTDADAIMQVVFGRIGYVSEPNSLSYRPWLLMHAWVVSRPDQVPLFIQAYAYGEKWGTPKGVELLPSDPAYDFRSFDALIANSAQAADGLRSGVDTIAHRITSVFP